MKATRARTTGNKTYRRVQAPAWSHGTHWKKFLWILMWITFPFILLNSQSARACLDVDDLTGIPVTVSGTSFSHESIVVHKGDPKTKPFTVSLGDDRIWYDTATGNWNYQSGKDSAELNDDFKKKVQAGLKHLYYRKDSKSPTTAIVDWNQKGDLFLFPVDENQKDVAPKGAYLKFHSSPAASDGTVTLTIEVWQEGRQIGELTYPNEPANTRGLISRELVVDNGVQKGQSGKTSKPPVDLRDHEVSKATLCGSPVKIRDFETDSPSHRDGAAPTLSH